MSINFYECYIAVYRENFMEHRNTPSLIGGVFHLLG